VKINEVRDEKLMSEHIIRGVHMKKINFPMLLLAMLVVLMFCLVGIAIHYGNFWLVALFLILGFAFMGYGLSKRKLEETNE